VSPQTHAIVKLHKAGLAERKIAKRLGLQLDNVRAVVLAYESRKNGDRR
jgi:DNA-binding NarL/FixJ family response regulator